VGDGRMLTGAVATPSQTAGPFVSLGTAWAAGAAMVEEATPGAIVVTGTVVDGADLPVTDALLEFWQADGDGRFPPETVPPWTGFTRAFTGPDGGYRLVTVKPGLLAGAGGRAQAPHIEVSMFARGLLQRLVTRIYFSNEQANGDDPVLTGLGPELRPRLVARLAPGAPGPPAYVFDIHLQGAQETVFFVPS
jgi:protocatechuate 3,4-dioxygenase, alpha subunit